MDTFFEEHLKMLLYSSPNIISSVLSGKIKKITIPIEQEKINGKWITLKQEVFDLVNKKYYIVEVDKPTGFKR